MVLSRSRDEGPYQYGRRFASLDSRRGVDVTGQLLDDEVDERYNRLLDHDPVVALHDIEQEAGEEAELEDIFCMDLAAARALGVELDQLDEEPVLD